jgi:hypothetical protein
MAEPLSGIRILEVASHVFVPIGGGVLAEWGAEVVKVEHPVSGDPVVLTASLLTMGLALGAEGDVMGYLTVRYFGVEIYSSVLGIVTAGVATSFTLGSLLLSLTLRATGSYSLFLIIYGIAGLAGGGIFMLLKRQPVVPASVAAKAEESQYNAEPGTCVIKHTS